MIPPEANAEFVCQMEEILELYTRAYDPDYPLVCFDGSCKQLLGEIRQPLPSEPGHPERFDYQYEREGVRNLLWKRGSDEEIKLLLLLIGSLRAKMLALN